MNYKLTEEEVLEIIELYGGSRSIIRNIENLINSKGINIIEEDFIDLVAKCVFKHTTICNSVKRCKSKAERIKLYMSIDEIVDYYFEQYIEEKNIGAPENYEDQFLESPENCMKEYRKEYLNPNKKRHF